MGFRAGRRSGARWDVSSRRCAKKPAYHGVAAVPDLSFLVESAETMTHAAAPTLAFSLRLTNADPAEVIHTVVLRSQIQIQVSRRSYGAREQERLRDLFGEPDRWGQTLRPMLWTHASAVIPQFTGTTSAILPVACTFDFNV